LSRYADLTKPGTRVTVELIRDGKKVEVMVNLGQFEKGVQTKKVSAIRDFQDAVTRSSGETIPLLISREDHPLYISITR